MKKTSPLLIFAWLCISVLFLLIALRPSVTMWDYFNMHDSVKAFGLGLNPYDIQNLRQVIERPTFNNLNYIYSPIFLYPFLWLKFVSGIAGFYIWLTLKLITWVLIFYIWDRFFLKIRPNAWTLFFFIFAFNSTLYWDFTTGNISAFEELGIWSALVCLIKRRFWLFGLIIAVTAQMKFVPLFFLLLPIVLEKRRPFVPMFGSFGIFLGLFSLNYLIDPALFYSFIDTLKHLKNLPLSTDHGSLEFIGRMLGVLDIYKIPVHEGTKIVLFLVLFFSVGSLSVYAIQNYQKKTQAPDNKFLFLFFCVVYAVITPRMKDYSFVILLIPTLYYLRNASKPYLISLALIPAILPSSGGGLLPVREFVRVMYLYTPYLSGCVIWWLYYRWLMDSKPISR